MNANNRPRGKRLEGKIDGLADTQMAQSSGGVFDLTALSNEQLSSLEPKQSGPTGGTVTDSGRSRKSPVRHIDEVQRTARYGIVNEHARGGLGRILEARDQHLDRTVAIKELLRASTFTESLFVREALITARLQHPGIVPVHDAGRWPSGDPYYVMKLLSGKSMQTWIRDTKTLKERMSFLPNVIVVVETMAYAHGQGVIHRDIKPANIVVGEYGETVVVDWGLARDNNLPVPSISSIADAAFESDGVQSAGDSVWQVSGNYSISGKVVGTPAYMSPEQARGEDVAESTDVYALGALLYELLTGEPPYRGSKLQVVLEQVLAGPPRPLDECLLDNGERIKQDLIAIIEKAMAREPGDRYPSAKELAEDLNRFQTGQLVSAHQYTTWTLVTRWVRKHRTEVAVVVAALLLLAVTGVFSVNQVIEERNIATSERAQARAAQIDTEDKHRELLYLQAEGALERDPTETLAWLQKAPLTGVHLSKARELYRDAMSRGVAKHVFISPKFVGDIAYTRDGASILAADEAGGIRLIDVGTGEHSVLTVIDGHVTAMQISPDGHIAAIGTQSGKLHILSLHQPDRGEPLIHSIDAHLYMVTRLEFSSDGKHVFSLSTDRVANIWDMSSGANIRKLEDAYAAAITPDFEHLLVSRKDGSLEDISPSSGERQTQYSLPRSAKEIVISADGRYIAIYDQDWHIHLIDVQSGAVDKLGKGTWPTNYSSHMAFSPKGTWLATRGFGYSITLWNVQTKKQRILLGHENNIYNLYFSDDESRLISVSDDATARVWDTASDAVQELRGHADDVIRAAIAPTGEQLATLCLDGSLRIWDLHASESLRVASGDVPARMIRFLGNDSALLLSHEATLLRVRLSTGEIEQIAKSRAAEHYFPVSPDSKFILMVPAANDQNLKITDLERGQTHSFSMPPVGFVGAMWANDSAGLSVLFEDLSVHVWKRHADKLLVHQLSAPVCSVALAPGAQTLAVVRPTRIDILNTSDGSQVSSLEVESMGRLCQNNGKTPPPIYSPDGKWLTYRSLVKGIIVMDTDAVTARHFKLGGAFPGRLEYSHDSSKMAVHYGDRSTYLLHLLTGEEKLLGYHKDLVYRLAFSPDDKFLASGSHNQTIRIWNLETYETQRLRGHAGAVFDIAFSPDGNTLGSVSMDRTLRLWHVDKTAGLSATQLRALVRKQTTAAIGSRHELRTGTHEGRDDRFGNGLGTLSRPRPQ